MDFIEIIKNIRKERGHSQAEMAKFLNMEQSTYSSIERRRIKLSTEDFAKICKFLNLSPTTVLNPEERVVVLSEQDMKTLEATEKLITEIKNQVNIFGNVNIQNLNINQQNETKKDKKKKD